jgi:hypothetical protein
VTSKPIVLDLVFTALRGLLLLVAFPLLVLWLGWLVFDAFKGYLFLWQMREGLSISAVPYLPFALIALCSTGYVIVQVSLETWNRLRRHIQK